MGKTISETMFDRIAASEELPTIPGVALDVLAMAKRANVSLPDIADVVGRDPALAAKILRLANSSFFGVSAKTGTVTQALVRLGLRASLSVVLGFSILPKLARAGRQSTDMRLIWNMSLLSSVSAKVIEERTRGRFMVIHSRTEMTRPTPGKASLSMKVIVAPVHSMSRTAPTQMWMTMTMMMKTIDRLRRNFDLCSNSHGLVVTTANGSAAL